MMVLGLCVLCPLPELTSIQPQIQVLKGPGSAAQRKEDVLFQGRKLKTEQSKATPQQLQGKCNHVVVGMGPGM